MVRDFLETEQDVSARRNALMFLTNHDPDRAITFLSSHADKLIDWGAILQMAVVELIRKVLLSSFDLQACALWGKPGSRRAAM